MPNQKYTQRGSTNSEMNLALTLYLRKLTEWPIVIEHNQNLITHIYIYLKNDARVYVGIFVQVNRIHASHLRTYAGTYVFVFLLYICLCVYSFFFCFVFIA